MTTTPFVILTRGGRGLHPLLHRSRAVQLVGQVAVIIWASAPMASYAEVFYGFGEMTLSVQRNASGNLMTWNLPTTVMLQVESDFSTSELLAIELNIHETVYEDVSQNFAFSIGIEGKIVGPGPVDIDIIPSSDVWQSDTYWDGLEAEITLDRRVFNSTSHFETQVGNDISAQGWDLFNFNGFPASIMYQRAVYARALGSIEYADDEWLHFYLFDNSDSDTLAPAICNQTGCGDYNNDDRVDAADYVVWRKTLGQSGQGLNADGNSNALVEAADYYVWRNHFGEVATENSAQSSAPEPSTWLMLTAAASLCRCLIGRRALHSVESTIPG